MRTFNARVFQGRDAIQARMNLSAGQVCEFAREVASSSLGHVQLLVEPLWNGENEQQYLDRALPGTKASGFVFSAHSLNSEAIDERCQDFMDVYGHFQGGVQ